MRIELRNGMTVELPDTPPRARVSNKRIDDGLSATARLTQRNNDSLAAGIHPATGLSILQGINSGTCGECIHHHAYFHHTRTYHKCDCHRLGESHSSASDIRVSWPACSNFQRQAAG